MSGLLLVFGATGQVARELRARGDVLALGRDQADLTDLGVVRAAIETHAPRAVINAAAFTAVDKAEAEEALATTVNAAAPGAMAEVAAARNIPLLHISTDYVFAGGGVAPWSEEDPVGPISAYGRSKLAGEEAVRAAGGRHVILRTAWVFSASGANFVKTMLRLSETHSQLRVVADQVGCPTPAAGIADALLQMEAAMQAGHAGGTYHYAGQPAVSWADFARAIFKASGRDVAVEDIPTSDYPTPAQRPLNSRLDCAKIETEFGITQPDWREALAEVVRAL